MERKGIAGIMSIAGVSYGAGVSLAPLMEYFNVPMSPKVNIALLLFAILLVGIWYRILSRNSKQKLYEMIKLEDMPQKKLWIMPSSFKHFLNVLFSYVFLLVLVSFMFWAYTETKNVMVLIITSGFLLGFLMVNRKTVREGTVNVKVKNT